MVVYLLEYNIISEENSIHVIGIKCNVYQLVFHYKKQLFWKMSYQKNVKILFDLLVIFFLLLLIVIY